MRAVRPLAAGARAGRCNECPAQACTPAPAGAGPDGRCSAQESHAPGAAGRPSVGGRRTRVHGHQGKACSCSNIALHGCGASRRQGRGSSHGHRLARPRASKRGAQPCPRADNPGGPPGCACRKWRRRGCRTGHTLGPAPRNTAKHMLSSVTVHCNAAACKGRSGPSVRWRPARGQGGATSALRRRAHPRPKARDPMPGALHSHHLPRSQRAARPLAVGAPECTAIRATPARAQTSHCMAAAQAVAKAGVLARSSPRPSKAIQTRCPTPPSSGQPRRAVSVRWSQAVAPGLPHRAHVELSR